MAEVIHLPRKWHGEPAEHSDPLENIDELTTQLQHAIDLSSQVTLSTFYFPHPFLDEESGVFEFGVMLRYVFDGAQPVMRRTTRHHFNGRTNPQLYQPISLRNGRKTNAEYFAASEGHEFALRGLETTVTSLLRRGGERTIVTMSAASEPTRKLLTLRQYDDFTDWKNFYEEILRPNP